MRFIIQLSRILVGALFVFSGAIKANDPMGTSYKLQEYFTVFHVGFLNGITDYLSIVFCGLEIALGFALLVGAFSRITTLALTGLIIFFTWLTGYSAMTGKVTDCGCFGDFIHLEPKTSFYKDIILLVLSIVLLLGKDYIKPLLAGKWNNFVLVLLVGASFFLPIWAFMHLPVIDMLAYKPGNNISDKMHLPKGAITDSFVTVIKAVNKKTHQTEQMDMKEYMKKFNDYENAQTSSELVRKGDKPEIHDFIIFDESGRQVQDSLLHIPTYCFWVVVYDVENANKTCFTKINALVKNCDAQHIPVIGITHSEYKNTELFRHDVQAAFPFYYAGDDKFVKTMMRSNPGIMLIKNGVVIKKWHYNDVPTYDAAIR